jgi:hypothetical protein
MQLTPKVKEILSWYEGESPRVKGSFKRPKPEALALLDEVIKIYLNEA